MLSFKRILLCYDGTREGQHALKDGAALAQSLGADVHLLSVINNTAWMQGADITAAVPVEFINESARALLDEGLEKLAARGIRATGHIAIGEPLEQIPLFASDLNVDLVVVGHRRSHGLARWWGGRHDGLLLDRVTCSVLVTMGAAADVPKTTAGAGSANDFAQAAEHHS
ncbi:universal stress protein [Paraburkholderia sp. MMS20-SJTR3]|uniref:Universal stress protein n=1 Tax=Paraburkholderia sejongensis TaxID=2886946 RepID=A0ABS8JTB9_9BURK|nr:universal stress protein [Paraburkholderia sp. MMS20-SJTR3]MCC8392985.1 universal stress protein [Paraburkholderia sp. MMS20-SJTR3]